jgi:hypothetical protein
MSWASRDDRDGFKPTNKEWSIPDYIKSDEMKASHKHQAVLGDSVKPIFDACFVQLVELGHVGNCAETPTYEIYEARLV